MVELYASLIFNQHWFLSFQDTELDTLFSSTDLFSIAYFNNSSFSSKEKLVALFLLFDDIMSLLFIIKIYRFFFDNIVLSLMRYFNQLQWIRTLQLVPQCTTPNTYYHYYLLISFILRITIRIINLN